MNISDILLFMNMHTIWVKKYIELYHCGLR